jgi:FkbM family methyltransferase
MQRTGGTALADFLMGISEHASAEHNPFNFSNDRPKQFWPIVEAWIASRDRSNLKNDLEKLASQGLLIKHCYELFSMDFNTALLEATTKSNYRHILLRRMDEGARLVSKFIAEAHGTWFQEFGREPYAEDEQGKHQLNPIPVDLIVSQFHHARNCTAALQRAFSVHDIQVLECSHEDLNLSDTAVKSKCLSDLLDGLGFPVTDMPAINAAFLKNTKSGGARIAEIIDRVPNIEAVVAGLIAAGCSPPAALIRKSKLNELKAQLSRLASSRGWTLADNFGQQWPGFSFKFDHASSLEFRVESADMSFSNVFFGVKCSVPMHNKSLGEALAMALGTADYSESWPWCRHPNPNDDLLPISANWSYEQTLERDVPNGSLAAKLVAAADSVRDVLATFGYVAIQNAEWAKLQCVSAVSSDGAALRSRASLLKANYLSGLNFSARAVIDVGAWTGIGKLYAAFPDLPSVLVDPQRDVPELLESRPKDCTFVNKALGNRPGFGMLRVSGAKSSFLEQTSLTSDGSTETYAIEIITMDQLIEEVHLTGPFGVKLDTEGYEIEIINGLDRHASQVEFVICEARIREGLQSGSQFSDLVASMRDKGFLFYNFLSGHHRHPVFYEVLFLREGHPLFI